MDAKLADELRIRRNIATGRLAISCFVKPLENYFRVCMQVKLYAFEFRSKLVDRLDDDDSVRQHTTHANSRISSQYDRRIR